MEVEAHLKHAARENSGLIAGARRAPASISESSTRTFFRGPFRRDRPGDRQAKSLEKTEDSQVRVVRVEARHRVLRKRIPRNCILDTLIGTKRLLLRYHRQSHLPTLYQPTSFFPLSVRPPVPP